MLIKMGSGKGGPTTEEKQRKQGFYHMTAAQEAYYDKKFEQEMRGQRELINGRDFRWNTFRYQVDVRSIAEKFDDTFKDAPDSPEWWDKKFCTGCDKIRSMCSCNS